MTMNGSERGDVDLAAVAALLAEPARAAILLALCDGRALPAGELARLARVAPSTASAHLARLVEGGLLTAETCGRHRYYRLASAEVARAMEALAVVAPAQPVRSLRRGRAGDAVRHARTCYDHLAGAVGVAFTRALVAQGILVELSDGYEVTESGLSRLRAFGVRLPGGLDGTRFAPAHIDWSERYHHLAGPLAKAITDRLFELGWIRRAPAGRAVRLTDAGRAGLLETFDLDLDAALDREAAQHRAFAYRR